MLLTIYLIDVFLQALQNELEKASMRKNEMNGELERVKEENDELKFQVSSRS